MFHSTYPQSEIDKEVEVICDEIESYNDNPAELIYDEFENIVFRNHPLGHSILGTTRNVRSFTTEDARRFTDKFYRPDNCVFYIYGDIAFDEAVAALRNYTADVQRMASEAQPSSKTVRRRWIRIAITIVPRTLRFTKRRTKLM